MFIICGQQFGLDSLHTKPLTYIIYGVSSAICIGAMVLYDYFPKRLIIPCGLVGWAATALLLCWYYWVGPGALKM